MAEAASCLDVKSSFIVSLPRETRHLFRCRVEDGTLVELTRLSMGYKASPEILQIIITSAIAVVTTVAHPLWAAPPLVRVDVWTDNMRIAGPKSDAALWEAKCFLMRTAVTPRWGGSRIGRCAVHLSGGAVWSCSPDGVTE
ncbi:putative diacylglycerol kinase-like protein [Trypanosoma cruzi]|nr:putative diacylglycerol kinase-like protein [Trypanosoma cruzi]